jgi:ribosome modulation factor
MLRQDPQAWEAGYQAGLAGKTGPAPPGVDALAYYSGQIEGKADRAKPPEQRKPHTRPEKPKGP